MVGWLIATTIRGVRIRGIICRCPSMQHAVLELPASFRLLAGALCASDGAWIPKKLQAGLGQSAPSRRSPRGKVPGKSDMTLECGLFLIQREGAIRIEGACVWLGAIGMSCRALFRQLPSAHCRHHHTPHSVLTALHMRCWAHSCLTPLVFTVELERHPLPRQSSPATSTLQRSALQQPLRPPNSSPSTAGDMSFLWARTTVHPWLEGDKPVVPVKRGGRSWPVPRCSAVCEDAASSVVPVGCAQLGA